MNLFLKPPQQLDMLIASWWNCTRRTYNFFRKNILSWMSQLFWILPQFRSRKDLYKWMSTYKVGPFSTKWNCLLYNELISLKSFLPNPDDIHVVAHVYICFIEDRNMQKLYPNIWIVLRILFNIPITVTSCKEVFLSLSWWKSTSFYMTTLSINNNIAEFMDCGVLIREFAS